MLRKGTKKPLYIDPIYFFVDTRLVHVKIVAGRFVSVLPAAVPIKPTFPQRPMVSDWQKEQIKRVSI
jgi:hypothetical protein